MFVKESVNTVGLDVKARQNLVREKALSLSANEVLEVVSDDPRMPQVAEHVAKALGIIEVIRVDREEDGLYHGYFRRI